MFQLSPQKKKDFDGALEHAKSEAASIRTGRANASMVEDLPVEYYGSRMTIKELGTITVPEPRSLSIQPWDKGALAPIEKAIRDSSLGLNPIVDGVAVRLNIPPLTEERRKEFIKLLHQKMEDTRVRMRGIREDVLKEVKANSTREDDLRDAKEGLQKVMDEYNKKLDELSAKKEQELMS